MRKLRAPRTAAALALCLCLAACGGQAPTPAPPDPPAAPAPAVSAPPAAEPSAPTPASAPPEAEPSAPLPTPAPPEAPASVPTPVQPGTVTPAAEPEPVPAPAVPVPVPPAPAPEPEPDPDPQPTPQPELPETPSGPEEEATMIHITFNGHTYTAVPAQNSSAEAFMELLRRSGGSVTVAAHDYGGFEKVGPLPESLPRNDEAVDTTAGDLILYQGSNICLYYSTNSWTFTRLARLEGDLSSLKADLGSGDVSVTYSIGF